MKFANRVEKMTSQTTTYVRSVDVSFIDLLWRSLHVANDLRSSYDPLPSSPNALIKRLFDLTIRANVLSNMYSIPPTVISSFRKKVHDTNEFMEALITVLDGSRSVYVGESESLASCWNRPTFSPSRVNDIYLFKRALRLLIRNTSSFVTILKHHPGFNVDEKNTDETIRLIDGVTSIHGLRVALMRLRDFSSTIADEPATKVVPISPEIDTTERASPADFQRFVSRIRNVLRTSDINIISEESNANSLVIAFEMNNLTNIIHIPTPKNN